MGLVTRVDYYVELYDVVSWGHPYLNMDPQMPTIRTAKLYQTSEGWVVDLNNGNE